ncbi:MAG TPA: tetratricopeptide repeat protein, partial [Candidatus Kapabacteria bacterium]|nr:tetratricopeptide repeat protein [Candidatus Kapabacteria bacterium]
LNNKVIFSENLSKLYIAIGDYQNGLTEILSQFQVNWNLAITQGRIYALLINEEAEKYILNELRKFANNNSENILAQELLAWYYRTTNKLEQALDLFRNIDRLKKANGAEILRFAEECRRDGQFDVAIKAYGIVIDFGKSHPLFNSALYGYTRTLEQKVMAQKQISKESANDVVSRYKSIIKEFPNTQQATESRLRIAYILSNYLNNNDEAIKELNAAISERPRTSIAATATIDLANIYINLEKFDDATTILNNFIKNFANNFQSLANKANFMLAEILFFNGLLDSALKQYANLIIVPETDIANASLNRIVLIEQNKQYTKALSTFARAEFEERRNNLKEAIELYSTAANLSSGTELFELALKKKIEIEFLSDDYQSVVKTVDYLLEKVPDSIYGDFALLRKADSLVLIGNKQDALNLYTEILSKYPLSIYLPEIREKIRSLRNETI